MRLNLEDAAIDSEELILPCLIPDLDSSRLEPGEQWRMTRIDTQLAVGSYSEHHCNFAGENLPARTYDVTLECRRHNDFFRNFPGRF